MTPHRTRPRILLLSMYPLDRGAWGPTVRIGALRDALSELVDVDLVDGYRPARRGRLLRYVASGRLRGLDGVYVETSTFLPAELDLAFVALLRVRGIGSLTYFRDAYQLFPEYYPITSVGRWVAARAYPALMRALGVLSSKAAVPSAGLGAALLPGSRPLILPPGAPPPADVPYDPAAHGLLYVGDARLEAQGAPRLIDAVRGVRAAGLSAELTIVCREGQEPPIDGEPWIRVERASGLGIHRLLPGIAASVIPRAPGAYNDLAVPVKLFDYLSYGRPLLVTDRREQARVVRESGAGWILPDDPAGMADAIGRFLALPGEERVAMADAARRAATTNSWHTRARAIIEALGLAADEPARAAAEPSS